MKEKKASASVGTKMSLFEEKMKQEKAAREKEIETENRLRKKTPRLASTEEKSEVDILKQTKGDKEEDGKKEVAFALTTQKEKQPPTPKKRTTNVAEQAKDQKKVPTPKKRKDVAPLSPAPASAKDSTSSISSPQPIDCTEDTTVSDSNAFDISAILKSADAHKQLSPPPANTKAASRPDARTPMRSSTMKVVGGATPVVAKPIFDIDLTPVQVEEPDESLSDFAKQIQAKKNEINNLKSDMKKGSGKQPPVKPPRNNTEFPPTYEEFVAAKKDGVCLSLSLQPF